MPGAIGGLQRPDYGGYVNQPLSWSFLASMEYFLAFMPRFESRRCVDSREGLSLFHLFTTIGQGHAFVVCLFVGGGFCVFGVCCLFSGALDLSFSTIV